MVKTDICCNFSHHPFDTWLIDGEKHWNHLMVVHHPPNSWTLTLKLTEINKKIVFPIIHLTLDIQELDDGKNLTGKPDQFDGKNFVKTMVSSEFSLKPIQWLTSRNHLNAEICSRCRNKKGSRGKLKRVEALYPVSNMATGGHWRPLVATGCLDAQVNSLCFSPAGNLLAVPGGADFLHPTGLWAQMGLWALGKKWPGRPGSTVSPGSDGSGKVSLWQVARRDLSRDRHVHSTFQSNSVYNMGLSENRVNIPNEIAI